MHRSEGNDFGYHATSPKRLSSIKRRGLIPRRQPPEHDDEDRGVDGAVLFFCPQARYAESWGSVMLRFPRPATYEDDPYSDGYPDAKTGRIEHTSYYTLHSIQPHQIDVKRNGRWYPLTGWKGR